MKKLDFTLPQHIYDNVYSMPAWQKALIFAGSMIIPLVAFWYFFLGSTWDEIGSINNKIPAIKKEIARLKKMQSTLPQLEQEFKEMQGILYSALKLLPEKDDIPEMLTKISSFANQSRLAINTFTPRPEKVTGFYATIPFEIKLSGTFYNAARFLKKISRMERIVRIKKIAMLEPHKVRTLQSRQGEESADENINKNVSNQGSTSSAINNPETPESGTRIRGGAWLVNITCNGETYRFLTPEEQAAAKAKKKTDKKGKNK